MANVTPERHHILPIVNTGETAGRECDCFERSGHPEWARGHRTSCRARAQSSLLQRHRRRNGKWMVESYATELSEGSLAS